LTEIEGVDQAILLEDSGTRRLLLTQLHRDDEGKPESFELAYGIKRVSSQGEYLDGVRRRHQSRKAKPFLKGWRGAMSHWASHNVDALKNSLSCNRHEFDRSAGLRPMSDCVLVTPGLPARPELSSLVLWRPERSPSRHRPLLCVP
jgi:hypothetical protein